MSPFASGDHAPVLGSAFSYIDTVPAKWQISHRTLLQPPTGFTERPFIERL
jgi:hypothetical protein